MGHPPSPIQESQVGWHPKISWRLDKACIGYPWHGTGPTVWSCRPVQDNNTQHVQTNKARSAVCCCTTLPAAVP